MNNILKIIYFNTLSIFSISQNTPKLCINCKFYTKNFFTNSEFGKCSLFPIKKNNDYFLVNGNYYNNTEYNYCSILRSSDDMCGKEAKFYQKKK
jgi:hypothetical protein